MVGVIAASFEIYGSSLEGLSGCFVAYIHALIMYDMWLMTGIPASYWPVFLRLPQNPWRPDPRHDCLGQFRCSNVPIGVDMSFETRNTLLRVKSGIYIRFHLHSSGAREMPYYQLVYSTVLTRFSSESPKTRPVIIPTPNVTDIAREPGYLDWGRACVTSSGTIIRPRRCLTKS